MQRFLIIQTAFLGDVVLATALVEKIRQFYPGAAIDFMLRKGNEHILANNPHLRKLIIWDKKHRKLPNLFRIALSVRKERYDFVVNVHRGSTTGFVTWMSGAGERRGFEKNPFRWCYTQKFPHHFSRPEDVRFIHETERNQQLIADLTDDDPARPAMYPAPDDFRQTTAYRQKPYICIAPSSVWATKRYPTERWVELINAMPEGCSIYLLGGKEDREMADELKKAVAGKEVVNLSGELTMMQSAALMKAAVMNYTNDSGPMHFASAVNAPTTAVYCSTHPCFGFGPLSDISRVVQVDELYCKPCGLHGYPACPQKHFRCASEIKIQELLWWISPQI